MARYLKEYLAKPTDNPFYPPGPHCMPDYNGHIQGLRYELGRNRGRASYLILAKNPAFATPWTACLKHEHPLVGDTNRQVAEESYYAEAITHRSGKGPATHDGTRFTPGYTGLIPKAKFIFGKTFQKVAEQGFVQMDENYKKYMDHKNDLSMESWNLDKYPKYQIMF